MFLCYMEQGTAKILAQGMYQDHIYSVPKIGDLVAIETKGLFKVHDVLIQEEDLKFDITVYLVRDDA